MVTKDVRSEEEFNDLKAFLRQSKLPYQDIAPGKSVFQVFVNDAGKIIASGGIEFYSGYALLRSLAVAQEHQGKSIGREMVNDLLRRARSKSAMEVFLLTETAPDYFRKLGFNDRSRDSVPDAIKISSEFSTVCPTSAVCLSMTLSR
jgi:amino-acid N-acetyltransferase